MQNQSARVVLGACLFAASIAAQAPAPSTSSEPGTGAFATANAAGADSGLADPGAASSSSTSKSNLLRGDLRLEVPQDSVDYTLRGLFLSHHGDFMRLRERYTPQVEIAGRTIMNGRVMNDPGSFNIRRDDTRHHAFGGGIHYCLGAPLARLEARLAIGTIVQRFPNLRLAGEQLEWRALPSFRGLVRLPVLT